MAKTKNRNIVLLKKVDDLNNEPDYNNFQYKEHFSLLCNLLPNKENERLDIQEIGNNQFNEEGLVYAFVINGKILKIGHTITSIKKRIQSYNCGKTEYRISGTNSTTNYFILQSILNINEVVNVYAFFPDKPFYILFGKEYKDSIPSSKKAEKIILESFDKKPIGCTQT